MSLDPDEVRALARAIMQEVERRLTRAGHVSATVTSYRYDVTMTFPRATVRFPEDPADVSHEVSVLLAQPLSPGDIVTVAISPPHAGYVIGTGRPPEIPAARYERNVGATSISCTIEL